MTVEYRKLDPRNVSDVACCPGGLEVAEREFLGRQLAVTDWHLGMIRRGMFGLVAYADGQARGFVEMAPAETAPFPIVAPGAAVLLCFHWAGTDPAAVEHLVEEERMLTEMIDEARRSFVGIAALAWDHPIHFPLALFRRLGFLEATESSDVRLVWLPFDDGLALPTLGKVRFRPRELQRQGLLAIDQAYSHRCPYSVHHAERLKAVVAGHPSRARIDLRQYRIDTREEAFALAASPWDWGWIYLNGASIRLFGLTEREISARIAEAVPGGSDARSAPQRPV